eukprot:scaffold10016_cov54-Attheya_sp.AAC.7
MANPQQLQQQLYRNPQSINAPTFANKQKSANGDKIPLPYTWSIQQDSTWTARMQFASREMWTFALKHPAGVKEKKSKNHTINVLGETIGPLLHSDKQDMLFKIDLDLSVEIGLSLLFNI